MKNAHRFPWILASLASFLVLASFGCQNSNTVSGPAASEAASVNTQKEVSLPPRPEIARPNTQGEKRDTRVVGSRSGTVDSLEILSIEPASPGPDGGPVQVGCADRVKITMRYSFAAGRNPPYSVLAYFYTASGVPIIETVGGAPPAGQQGIQVQTEELWAGCSSSSDPVKVGKIKATLWAGGKVVLDSWRGWPAEWKTHQ